MKGLPPEIQLLIIENLDVLDVFHLQQTCKYLYKLIEAFDHVIWRKCLQQQCTQNGLFWPSYRKHATSDEFKDACTTNLRFRNASRKWEDRSASTIPSTVEKLEFDWVPFDEFYLVPGGRFLITLHKLFFRIWSLYPSTLRNDAPKVGYTDVYYMQCPFSGIAYANVVHGTKIELLLSGTTKSVALSLNRQFVSPTAYRSDHEDQEMTSLLHLEITIEDGSDMVFSFRKSGLIQFLHGEGEDTPNLTILGDGNIVVFQTSSGITMAWDSAHHHCFGWRPEGIGDAVCDWELFSNDEFVFYVNGSGVHGFKIPPLQPITEEYVTLSSFSDNRFSSSFFIPHIRPYDITDSACIISQENCFPISDQQPVIYIIKEIEDNDDDDSTTILLHWYQFRFDSSNPGSSTLTLLDTTSLKRDCRRSLSPCRTYNVWGDQVAIVWESEDEDDSEQLHTSFYLSLSTIPSSPTPSSFSRASSPNSQGKAKENFKILPFARYPVAPDDDTVPVPLGQNDESWVDWYDFVAKD
ncbi:hypothetical protein H1R20_g8847, partial [Candolleomyces eurysporus]